MKVQAITGWILLVLSLILGGTFLSSDMLFFRLIVGMALGYVLARSYMGFAGSINRAYRTGSTKLMRGLMLMFFISAVLNSGLIYHNITEYLLWVEPINLGLIIGGLLFGFGMSISICCGSGVLVDLVGGLPRALITLFFFMFGVFIAFPVQKTASFVRNSWFNTPTGAIMDGGAGVYLPDLFGGQTVLAYLLSLVVTGVLCLSVVWLSYKYENKRKSANSYQAIPSEEYLLAKHDTSKAYRLFSKETYDRAFVQPWNMKVGIFAIAIIFTIMMSVTGEGWGTSTPYGWWFGKLLILVGFSADSIASFTHWSVAVYTRPFFEDQISVQNLAIALGALIFTLHNGRSSSSWKASLSISKKSALLFALGGLSMGVGTRLANGCNVGALYTPIANFSLSGWFFLVFMSLGAIAGNKFKNR